MDLKKISFIAILLIFICCIGAASATDISDDALSTDSDDTVVEQTDDTTLEVNNDESEILTASSTQPASTWSQIKSYAETSGTDYTINLVDNTNYTINSQIKFANNAKIIGTPNSYIKGSFSGIPFYNSNSNYHITFQNVNFKDISCTMLMQMLTTETTVLDGCTFTNVNASSTGHNSVIYNNQGTMNITDCTFSNCKAAFGVVTNHNAYSTTNVIMNVKDSTFENNYGYTEPGAINNCGQLYVWTSTFNNNYAVWWAGAIHTHTNAKTVIRSSSFDGNTAGWNGGALYTYANLEVYDSNFTYNNCSYPQGGGAIGASNYYWASTAYNVIVDNCRFEYNKNLASNGQGGAIAAMNGGTLTVTNSFFNHNCASNGQAISGHNTNDYANISEGNAKLVIKDNIFMNHDCNNATTVFIDGDYFTFEGNTFSNSPQIVYGDVDDNVYDEIITITSTKPILQSKISKTRTLSEPKQIKDSLLGVSENDVLTDSNTVYLEISNANPEKALSTAEAKKLSNAITEASQNGIDTIIYVPESPQVWKLRCAPNSFRGANITIIGAGMDKTFLSATNINFMASSTINNNNSITFINLTFAPTQQCTFSANDYNFINCSFIGTPIDLQTQTLTVSSLNNTNQYNNDIFSVKFENCFFINYTLPITINKNPYDRVIYGGQLANISLIGCTFENITADQVFYLINNFTDDNSSAQASIKDCIFNNVTVNNLVKAQKDSSEFITIKNIKNMDIVKKEDGDYVYYMGVPQINGEITITIDGVEYTIQIVNSTTENISTKLLEEAIDNATKLADELAEAKDNATKLADELAEAKDNATKLADELAEAKDNATKLADELTETNKKVKNLTSELNDSKVNSTVKELVGSVVSAADLKVKAGDNGNIQVTLKDINNNLLGNQTVSVIINGVTYNGITNDNGVASINVKFASAGTFYATVSFAGDNSYKSSIATSKVVVSKKATKITAPKKTFKVKTKTKKIKITLKSGKTVLKSKKITLKVNGKTYTAKTNKKGIATIKITKLTKKGTLKYTVKFAGDKAYKAVTKKGKITLK